MSSIRGEQAELAAVFWMLSVNPKLQILRPVVDNGPVDLVWHAQGVWNSAQVKRVYMKNGHPTINLVRHDGRTYEPDDADYIIAVQLFETGGVSRIWCIPMERVCANTRIRITSKYDKFEMVAEETGEE